MTVRWAAALVAITLICAAIASAQLPVPASSQFDITGFLQSATVDTASDAHSGGSLTVNNHQITVPRETIVILPANALTWQELFAQNPAANGKTGLAIADGAQFTYEVHVIGNRVGDKYIAGLIYLAQQGLNSGQGFINYMDYASGELYVGGTIGVKGGTRIQINDPSGRFGRAASPDQRFGVDPDNPTIAAATGFPMCFPRVTTDPTVTGNPDDPLCPQNNRPLEANAAGGVTFATNIQMRAPGNGFPDPTQQAPLEVGDYVTYAGTLMTDSNGPYVSAHTISNNVAIYTWPGTNPAYVSTEVALIGTGGLTVLGGGEAAIRTRFEGMSTDPSRNVHLYGMDFDPTTGKPADRDWGTIGVDPGPPNGAVKGRWRFRPPCTATTATDKACTPPPGGTFLPPTREVRAVIEGAWTPGQTAAFANGIIAGQYHAPILEYIFPENIPGTPIVENNFNAIDFLSKGGYTSSAGTQVGVLDPWPSNVIPAGGCTGATANAGGPYTVASGGTVTLAGSATGSSPFTYSWSAPSQGTLSDAAVANPVYTAPAVATQTVVPLTLTVTNCGAPSVANTTVTINAAAAPTVNHVAPVTVLSGQRGNSVAVSGSDPANLKLTFTATQSGTPALIGLKVTSTGNTTANLQFDAPALPLGQVTPAVINLNITATNSANVPSAPEFTTVTVNPLPDSITITSAEYRTSKQRLIINATSSVISPNVVLKLQPYLTTTGKTYDPDPAKGGVGNVFTNQGGGLYLIDLVGAPQPASGPVLTVTSNLNGTSPATGLTRIRQ